MRYPDVPDPGTPFDRPGREPLGEDPRGPGYRHQRRGPDHLHHHPEGHGMPLGRGGMTGRGERGGGPRGRGERSRGRAQRGDVRAAVLMLLAESPMHGYQLIQAIEERSSGAWRPSPGAIYPTLNLLEDEGLITTVSEAGRNLASLTDAGREMLASLAATHTDPFAGFGSPGGGGSLVEAFGELREPVRQVARSGDPAQVEAARALLVDTRRSLYLILAGVTPPEEPGA